MGDGAVDGVPEDGQRIRGDVVAGHLCRPAPLLGRDPARSVGHGVGLPGELGQPFLDRAACVAPLASGRIGHGGMQHRVVLGEGLFEGPSEEGEAARARDEVVEGGMTVGPDPMSEIVGCGSLAVVAEQLPPAPTHRAQGHDGIGRRSSGHLSGRRRGPSPQSASRQPGSYAARVDEPAVIVLSDGRRFAFDDVGDPDGVPLVYVHGTPDSRLSRHPDDGIATSAGVRLLALDRPGTGDSDPHLDATLVSLGQDIAALLDHLQLRETLLLGWSSGGLSALAAASMLGDRVRALGLVAPIPPVEAYQDVALVASLGPTRRAFVELALEVPAGELAAEVAPFLVPLPLSPELALEHVLEGAGERGREELATVSGAAAQLARGLEASVVQGTAGLHHDLVLQLEPGLDLTTITTAVRTFHGGADGVSPPLVGSWLVARLPNAVLDLSEGASHHLLFPRWRGILRALRRDAAM